ncbi:MAG TPA: ABC-2 transporter permease [Syntrophomonas sp.]|nr:ABC-2 transporter permease [Syntrophomonas sp.]
MNKALAFVRLDFITVKPYLTWKNLIIFSIVALIMIISSDSGASAIGILMALAVLYVSYPFAVGEKNGIDALYITLSIQRGTVVLGRYLFALIVDICTGLFAYGFTFVILTFMKKDFNAEEALLTIAAMFVVFSVLQAVQLPIFFKLGYMRAKLWAYLPFLGFPLVVLLAANFLKDTVSMEQLTNFLAWFAANPVIAVLLGAIIWLGLMVISYRASLGYYNKRDF